MQTIQNLIAAFIEDVNLEDGLFLYYSGKLTHLLFFIIKWAGIPYILYILFEFYRL